MALTKTEERRERHNAKMKRYLKRHGLRPVAVNLTEEQWNWFQQERQKLGPSATITECMKHLLAQVGMPD